jgi:hypothetical protein
MRIRMILVLVSIFLIRPAAPRAQAVCGNIVWSEDKNGMDCNLTALGGMGHKVYWLWHYSPYLISGAAFKVHIGCISWLAGGAFTTWGPGPNFDPRTDTPWSVTGSYTAGPGVVFDYGRCVTESIVLLKYEGFGPTAPTCCEWYVYPHDSLGFQVMVCDYGPVLWDLGASSYFNYVPERWDDCLCPFGGPLPASESTWGRIKTLYDQADE